MFRPLRRSRSRSRHRREPRGRVEMCVSHRSNGRWMLVLWLMVGDILRRIRRHSATRRGICWGVACLSTCAPALKGTCRWELYIYNVVVFQYNLSKFIELGVNY